jgi:antitoxin component YwqK of YwqJK toxin-antitoxin module
MKQVILLTLFVSGVCVLQAQNSPANQFASINNLPQIKLPVIQTAAVFLPPATDLIGKKYKGTWQSHYPNGNPCDSGYLYENMPDGIWKSWYPNGQLRMQIECSSKKLVAAKDEMQRIYKPGYAPNPGSRQLRQMVANSGGYPSDKLVYRPLFFATHPPDMDNNLREVKVQVQSGDSMNSFTTDSPPFTECLVHGAYKTWFDNGMLKDSGYCDNGVREGVWAEWDEEEDMRAVGFYKNGMRWKDWRFYNREGKLQYIRWYNRLEEVTETIVLK